MPAPVRESLPAHTAASSAAGAGAWASRRESAQKSPLWGEAGGQTSLFPYSLFPRTGIYNGKQTNSGKEVSCASSLANVRCCKGESDLVLIRTIRTSADFQIFFLNYKYLLYHDVHVNPEEEKTPTVSGAVCEEPSSRCCRECCSHLCIK